MVATWVVAGAAYASWIALTGVRGVPGVIGLILFVLVVAFSPGIAELLEASLD